MIVERKRGRAGQRQRLRRLRRTNGLCELCFKQGHTTVATVVDHEKPLAHGGLDVDENTRNLCDEHHRQVTAEQFGHQVARGARGVGLDGRPIDRDHPWSGRPPGGGQKLRPAGPGHRAVGPCAARANPNHKVQPESEA